MSFSTFIVKFKDNFCNTSDVVENTNFWEKGNLSSEKNHLTIFSHFIE